MVSLADFADRYAASAEAARELAARECAWSLALVLADSIAALVETASPKAARLIDAATEGSVEATAQGVAQGVAEAAVDAAVEAALLSAAAGAALSTASQAKAAWAALRKRGECGPAVRFITRDPVEFEKTA